MNFKALAAEFIGTFTLIFIGVGSLMANAGGLVGAAIAHGVAIAVMVSALGAISGGHFNPGISFGAWIGHKISTMNMVFYWIAQVAGAAAGAFLLEYCIPDAKGTGTPALANGINVTQGLILEAIGTFFLVLVVYGTAIDKRAPKVGGLFIGLTITICILCFGPVTGSSINPARFLGPAIAEGNFTNVAVYIFGPLIGGGIAGGLYNYFFADKEPIPAPPTELVA
ncbi:MAG TPA: aquaporin [Fimbriimonadaceae bacterium]|jgi:aquaporin Z